MRVCARPWTCSPRSRRFARSPSRGSARRRRRGLLAWALTIGLGGSLALATAGRAGEASRLVEARLRITCEPASSGRAWEQFAAACLEGVDALLGGVEEPARTIRVRFGPGPVSAPASDPFSLRFGPADSMEVVTHQLMRALLQRRVAGPAGDPVPSLPATDWLAAALTQRLLGGQATLSGRPSQDYEPARYAFQHGRFPNVTRLVESPVPPTALAAYRLYALHCELLAVSVAEATDLDVFQRLLELDAHGRPPAEALAFVVQEATGTGDSLQAWYESTVLAVSRRGRRGGDTESIAERFAKAGAVAVVAPGERDFRGGFEPLEELPDELAALQADATRRGRVQTELFELLKDAPILLQQPIAAFADAIARLGKERVRRCRRDLQAARQDFAKALARQRALDAYLDAEERHVVPAEQRFALRLEVVRRYAGLERELAPDLHGYLDQVVREGQASSAGL